MSSWPRVVLTDETMREGMQIESVSITLEQKLELLDAISDTGLRRIVVGSFVSLRWTPQMAEIETLIERMQPRAGITYLALALKLASSSGRSVCTTISEGESAFGVLSPCAR